MPRLVSPRAQVCLGPVWPCPAPDTSSCVLERQSPCGCWGTKEAVYEYLRGLREAGASTWVTVRAVPPGRVTSFNIIPPPGPRAIPAMPRSCPTDLPETEFSSLRNLDFQVLVKNCTPHFPGLQMGLIILTCCFCGGESGGTTADKGLVHCTNR